MSDPTPLDLVFGTVVTLGLFAFGASTVICRHRIDAWALDRERREGRAKGYFQLLPPVAIVLEEWRFVARFRDRTGYALALALAYFIVRAVWSSVT